MKKKQLLQAEQSIVDLAGGYPNLTSSISNELQVLVGIYQSTLPETLTQYLLGSSILILDTRYRDVPHVG